MKQSKGSVLVALLWCLALLSVVVIGLLHTARLDLMVQKNYGDRIQAHYLAVAGIEKAKALLYADARERSRTSRHHNGALYDDAGQFRDVSFGRGQFRVFRRGREDEGGGVMYGVSDEESRLNVNIASPGEFNRIEFITPDVTAAILDWRDADNQVTPGGAEADYYMSLQPPSLPRNGPVQTIRELLMVRGISSELLLGDDQHQNGGLDTADDPADEIGGGTRNLGWAGLFTVDSSIKNLDAAGEDRVNVTSADERELTGVRGITSEIARAIIAYRGQNRFNTLADLLDVPPAPNQNQPGGNSGNSRGNRPGGQQNSPGSNIQGGDSSGNKVISSTLLMDIADQLTAQSDSDLAGVVNVNTASLEVLTCLPGLTRETAQAIISFRKSNGFLPNIAWLLKVPGITPDIFKQLAPRVSVRSETFRILCEGKVTSTGARQRIQEIVRVGLTSVKTLAHREDDL